jgi:hypothetical protein
MLMLRKYYSVLSLDTFGDYQQKLTGEQIVGFLEGGTWVPRPMDGAKKGAPRSFQLAAFIFSAK